jgi:hypothetical protein
MFDLGNDAPALGDIVTGSGVFVEKRAAAELRAVPAVRMVEVTVVKRTAEAEFEEEAVGDVGRPGKARIDLVRFVRGRDGGADVDTGADQPVPSLRLFMPPWVEEDQTGDEGSIFVLYGNERAKSRFIENAADCSAGTASMATGAARSAALPATANSREESMPMPKVLFIATTAPIGTRRRALRCPGFAQFRCGP